MQIQFNRHFIENLYRLDSGSLERLGNRCWMDSFYDRVFSLGVNSHERHIPLSRSCSAAPNKLPARTTTDVVPSPASTSWAADKSTSCFYFRVILSPVCTDVSHCRKCTILAAGCMTDIFFKIVAPSLEMTTSPVPEMICFQRSKQCARAR